jgi:hypothetical protein
LASKTARPAIAPVSARIGAARVADDGPAGRRGSALFQTALLLVTVHVLDEVFINRQPGVAPAPLPFYRERARPGGEWSPVRSTHQ